MSQVSSCKLIKLSHAGSVLSAQPVSFQPQFNHHTITVTGGFILQHHSVGPVGPVGSAGPAAGLVRET